MMMLPYAQSDFIPLGSILVRAEGNTAQVEQSVRKVVQAEDAENLQAAPMRRAPRLSYP